MGICFYDWLLIDKSDQWYWKNWSMPSKVIASGGDLNSLWAAVGWVSTLVWLFCRFPPMMVHGVYVNWILCRLARRMSFGSNSNGCKLEEETTSPNWQTLVQWDYYSHSQLVSYWPMFLCTSRAQRAWCPQNCPQHRGASVQLPRGKGRGALIKRRCGVLADSLRHDWWCMLRCWLRYGYL